MSRAARSNLVDLELVLAAETPDAILVKTDQTQVAGEWLPRSQIEVETNGLTVIVTLPRWLAEDRGLV